MKAGAGQLPTSALVPCPGSPACSPWHQLSPRSLLLAPQAVSPQPVALLPVPPSSPPPATTLLLLLPCASSSPEQWEHRLPPRGGFYVSKPPEPQQGPDPAPAASLAPSLPGQREDVGAPPLLPPGASPGNAGSGGRGAEGPRLPFIPSTPRPGNAPRCEPPARGAPSLRPARPPLRRYRWLRR